ncbi:MAG: hypothetical protein HY817_04260 [Candidatus Abawacabacteria bacterium]|nr:hypothetical protein [Candidatus Abawacabacteria bacterium]
MNKICNHCQNQFEINEQDLTFYDKVSPIINGEKLALPPPSLCQYCRQRRRQLWRNERKLYNRKCDLTGKQIISVHAPDCQYKVYEQKAWWSDQWDDLSLGRDFDFSKTFFEQYKELMKVAPRSALWNVDPENSDYNQSTGWLKNCYLMAAANRNQDCYYGNYVNDCRDCVDNLMIKNSELCYECIECEECYDCAFCKNCNGCQSSQFLISCIGCNNCFGCVNLQRKQYCFFNEQLSKEEYEKRLSEIRTNSYTVVEKLKEVMQEKALQFPHKFMIGSRNENVTGNSIFFSRNCESCYDVSKLENCKYAMWFHDAKDCMDVFAWGMPAELCYDSMEVGGGAYQNLFCATCNGCKYAYYATQCMFSEHIFGCASLRRRKYCILNKQYSQADYEALLPRIIKHMQTTGEWGEFFPLDTAPYAYNETVAIEYYPISKEEALHLGAKWKEDQSSSAYQGPEIKVPDDIHEVSEDICKNILTCEKCQKNYRIIQQELQFYKNHHFPVPHLCPMCRHQNRLNRRNPRRLWDRSCMKCNIPLKTTYAPERAEKVLCESCYSKEL